MEFFSGSTPNLVSKKSIKNMENLVHVDNPIKEVSITDSFSSFYNYFIEPNIFIISLVIIFILFLVYKYYTKEDKPKNNTNNLDEFKTIFNSNTPFEENSYAKYSPNQIPLLFDEEMINYNDQSQNVDHQYQYQYQYPAFIQNTDKEDMYNGTYKDNKNFDIPNPYDWSMNYNNATENSIQNMTDINRQNLNSYELVTSEQDYNLIYNMNNGSNDDNQYQIVKPYI